jgi:hypothetical protein
MDKISMCDPPQETESVVSSGDRLTIETIGDFIQSLRQGLNEARTVLVEFNPDVELDMTALQVLCSACKTAAAEGKNFKYRGLFPQALQELSVAAGAERHEHCSIDNTSCFRQLGGATTWEN